MITQNWCGCARQESITLLCLVGLKRRVGCRPATVGFQDVYRRVVTLAKRRISQLSCPETGEVPTSIILGQTWRPLGEKIITSLVTFCLRCSAQNGLELGGEPTPSEEALRFPGGATLEDLERLALAWRASRS
jgi:hypothetical protein